RQCGRIVAKQQHALVWLECLEGPTNLRQMHATQRLPVRALAGQRLGFVNRKGEQRRGDAHQEVIAQFNLPKRLQGQVRGRSAPTRQTKASFTAEQTQLAQLVVADDALESRSEAIPEFGQALSRAFEGGVVAHADEPRIARVIAVGDDDVGGVGSSQEVVEQVVVGKGIAQPDIVPISLDHAAEQRIGNDPSLVPATELLRVTGVVNIAEEQNGSSARHEATMLRPGSPSSKWELLGDGPVRIGWGCAEPRAA